MMPVRLTIIGTPRTKKNSMQRTRNGGLIQGKGWRDYERTAVITPTVQLPVGRYNVRALVYREANRGDLLNYLAGTSDLMEKRGVVTNDRQFLAWDGSRMFVDRARPRVEVEISDLEDT